jgi:hypothetical protein
MENQNQGMEKDFENKLAPKNQTSNDSLQFSPTQIINKNNEFSSDTVKSSYPIKALATTFNLFVGKIQDGIATLLSDDFNLIEIPTNVLPSDLRKGNILKITIERNIAEEERRRNEIVFLQKALLEDENLFLKGTA